MIRLNEMTDEELALSYVRGNNQAFDLLLSRNQSKLFTISLIMNCRRCFWIMMMLWMSYAHWMSVALPWTDLPLPTPI